MDKSNYKRRTSEVRKRTSSGTRDNGKDKKKDIREVIVMQSIVSGIVLASVMLVGVIKTDFTIKLKDDLKNALTKTTSVEEIKKTADNMSVKYLSIQNSVKTIFNGTLEKENTFIEKPVNLNNGESDNKTKVTDVLENNKVETTIKESNRIDEDILNQINETSSVEEKK